MLITNKLNQNTHINHTEHNNTVELTPLNY